jgi:formylglycine-generating enzyme required for sulfatase activity
VRRLVAKLALLLLLAVGSSLANFQLSKEDLLTLLKEGFGENLIIEKIRASGVSFELTVPVMVELKRAGATDRILEAILGGQGTAAGPAPPSGPVPSPASVPLDDMVLIPAGPFTMGLLDGKKDFSPDHTVYLDAFYMDRHEVTNAEYEKLDPSHRRDPASDCDDCPVVNVSWPDAATYARWMEKRLPTEAEWEKAARGPEGYLYGYGNEFRKELARVEAPAAARVGSSPANGYGVFEMLGNVWEWCADYYGRDYYRESPEENPKGPASGPGRVVRGGSHKDGKEVHLAVRTWSNAAYRYRSIGFRCARDGPREKP